MQNLLRLAAGGGGEREGGGEGRFCRYKVDFVEFCQTASGFVGLFRAACKSKVIAAKHAIALASPEFAKLCKQTCILLRHNFDFAETKICSPASLVVCYRPASNAGLSSFLS